MRTPDVIRTLNDRVLKLGFVNFFIVPDLRQRHKKLFAFVAVWSSIGSDQ